MPSVEILTALNIEHKSLPIVIETEILSVTEIEKKPPAADTAASTPDAVVS